MQIFKLSRRLLAVAICLQIAIACTNSGYLTEPKSAATATPPAIAEADSSTLLKAPIRDANIHIWADAAANAMWFRYYSPSDYMGGDGWGFAQAFDAITDGARRTAGTAHLDKLIHLVGHYTAMDYSPFQPLYYDDHAWMALALIRAATHLEQTPALQNVADLAWKGALQEYNIVRQGLDPNTGRMFWRSDKQGYANAANAPSSMIGCNLFESHGQNASDLAFAKGIYKAWRAVNFDPNTGQVNDSVDLQGGVTTWQFSYNYGTMLGAALCLHRTTGDGSYWDDAVLIGNHMLASMSAQSGNNLVMAADGCESGCGGDGVLFKGIGMRYFAGFARSDPNHTNAVALLNGTSRSLFAHVDTNQQLSSNWAHAPFSSDGLGAQTSGLTALAAAGEGAWGSPQGRYPALSYEAEDQNLTNIGKEATTGSFSGSGYLAGWNSAGSKVTFPVVTPYAGSHRLVFRLSNSGSGSRLIRVGNATQVLPFPASQGYASFIDVSAVITLAKGLNSVELAYDTASGSSQYVNLDKLMVYPVLSQTAPTGLCAQANLLAPIDGRGVGNSIRFVWEAVPGATGYDLVVDDQVVATTTNSQVEVLATALSDGPHRWYVVAKNKDIGTPSLAGSFVSCATGPKAPSQVTLTESAAGLTIGWAPIAPSGTVRVNVEWQGKLRCAQVTATSCLIRGVTKTDLASAAPLLRFANAAGEVVSALDASGQLTVVAPLPELKG